jgi:hypothetical protein
LTLTKECFWDHCGENELDIFLAKSIIRRGLNHAKEKREKAREEKIYQVGLN